MDGFRHIQLAVDGQLAPAIDDHISTRENFPTDSAYFVHIAKRSREFLHLFGDPRNPLPEQEVQRRLSEPF